MYKATELALRTWYPQDNPLHLDSEPALAGLVGEAGEIVDLLKKSKYKYQQPVDRDKFLAECGDFWYYLRIVAYQENYDLEESMRRADGIVNAIVVRKKDLMYQSLRISVDVAAIVENDICTIEEVLQRLILMINLFDCTIDQLTELNYAKLSGGKHGWKEQSATILNNSSEFSLEVPLSELEEKCKDIASNPDKYCDFGDKSGVELKDLRYRFLTSLFVCYPPDRSYVNFMNLWRGYNLQAQIEKEEQEEQTATIYGSEIDFNLEVPLAELEVKCQDIWKNASKYSHYRDESEEAYYDFTKFLWVKYPDGRPDERLCDIVT